MRAASIRLCEVRVELGVASAVILACSSLILARWERGLRTVVQFAALPASCREETAAFQSACRSHSCMGMPYCAPCTRLGTNLAVEASMSFESLLAAVIANPEDDVLRLAFADWFEENGQSERAEFIRVQIERARLQADDPRQSELMHREIVLLAEHGREWFGFPSNDYLIFRRGFVEGLALHPAHKLQIDEIFRAHPIRELRLVGTESGDGARLAERPELARIERLWIDSAVVEPNAYDEVKSLLASKWWRNVRMLRLRTAFAEDDLRTIFSHPGFANLRELQINFGAADLVIDALTAFPNLPLESLWVHPGQWGTCSLTDTSLTKLATSPIWKHLRELDVGVAPFDGVSSPRFSRVLGRSNLRTLRVRSWYMSNGSAEECVANLLAAKSWGRLESLTLGYIGFNADRLLTHPKLSQLRTLNLYRNTTAEDLTDRLFTCSDLAGLRELRVDMPCTSPVLASRKARPMNGLRSLQASLSTEAIQALSTSPHFKQLRCLHLNPVATEGVKALARSTSLPSLNRVLVVCQDDAKPTAADVAKFADRSAFPNLGQVWFNGGRWGRTSVAAILKRGSIPWPLLSSRALDAAAHERRNTRALGLGGFQPPLDERFDPTWDGE